MLEITHITIKSLENELIELSQYLNKNDYRINKFSSPMAGVSQTFKSHTKIHSDLGQAFVEHTNIGTDPDTKIFRFFFT